MIAENDSELLGRFAENGDEAAFRELVVRHLRLVYSSALRQVRDRHLAEEVSQTVFTLLARKAHGLVSHPALVGWLFATTRNCARDAARSAASRRQREEAFAMQSEPEPDSASIQWERVAPALDEALHDLGARDRATIVLRFLEEHSYVEVGRALGLSENAARMRTERALQKLKSVLGRRGITSTAAALGAALAAHGSVATPAHLLPQVMATCTAPAAAGGAAGGLVAKGFLMMKSTNVVATGIAVAACAVVVYEVQRANRADTLALERGDTIATLRADLAKARLELAESHARLQSADEDTVRLLGAIQSRGNTSLADRPQTAAAKPNRAEVEERFEQARRMAGAGRSDEAMREYLWCYDEGMIGGFSFMASRSKLVEAMGELAKIHPPMREAMEERWSRAEEAMLRDAHDVDRLQDFALLSRALENPGRVVDAYTKLPAGDIRRGSLLNMGAFDELVEQRRYKDVLTDRSFAQMSQSFDMLRNALQAGASAADQARYRSSVVEMAAKNLEVLAGAGQLVDARRFAAKILAYDGSEDARRMLHERLARVGRAELMNGIPE